MFEFFGTKSHDEWPLSRTHSNSNSHVTTNATTHSGSSMDGAVDTCNEERKDWPRDVNFNVSWAVRAFFSYFFFLFYFTTAATTENGPRDVDGSVYWAIGYIHFKVLRRRLGP